MNQQSGRDRGEPSRLFEILDGIAGVTEKDLDTSDTDLETCERVPLSAGLIDRTIDTIRSISALERVSTPPPSRWRPRSAAALPIAFSVFLLAATTGFFLWSGRNSTKELTFEGAVETVFDARQPMVTRHAAYGHVAVSIKNGISAIKKCALAEPRVRTDAEATFKAIRRMCDDPSILSTIDPTSSGHLKALLATIREEDREDLTPTIDAIKDFARSAEFGIDALVRGAGLGPQFQRTYPIMMDQIRNRLKW